MDFPNDLELIVLIALLACAAVGGLLIVRARRAAAEPAPASVRPLRGKVRRRRPDGTEILTAVGGGALIYFLAEVFLAAYPHPLHWGAAFVAAATGYGAGWAWSVRH